MQRTLAYLGIAAGGLLLALGTIFLCAAIQQPQRLLLAVLLLAFGGGMAGAGLWTVRRLRALAPDTLDDQITALARRHNGEITREQVVAALGVPDDAAQQALDLLEGRGSVQREWRTDRAVYVFPGLRESRVRRRCAHCHSEFSVAQPLSKCPNCGGNQIELVRE
jgi:hypothetical protein